MLMYVRRLNNSQSCLLPPFYLFFHFFCQTVTFFIFSTISRRQILLLPHNGKNSPAEMLFRYLLITWFFSFLRKVYLLILLYTVCVFVNNFGYRFKLIWSNLVSRTQQTVTNHRPKTTQNNKSNFTNIIVQNDLPKDNKSWVRKHWKTENIRWIPSRNG